MNATAAAVLAGPMLAVVVGIVVYRHQQDSQVALQRFLVEGVERLSGALNTLLSIHLLNYQIANYSIRLLETYKLGGSLVPDPEEVSHFHGLDLGPLVPLDALSPVGELVGSEVVFEWVVSALSDVTLEAKEFEFQIRQPVAAYYRSDPQTTQLQADSAVEQLTEIVEAWNARIQAHFALLDRLSDLASHLVSKRPYTMRGYHAIHKRSEVKQMRTAWEDGLAEAGRVKKETEAVLRSGGKTNPSSDAPPSSHRRP